jgi:N-acetylglucosaminyl-diphospho-decaprenol L-rhamnosyltransferase
VHVSVVIVGFRNVSDILLCLRALERSDYDDFDVIICENGGGDAYQALLGAIPGRLLNGQAVRAIEAPHNLGYGGGVNLGIASAPDADAWWILNPDTEAEPAALSALVRRLGEGGCDAVGGTIYLPGNVVQSHGGRWRAAIARAVSIGHGGRLDQPVDAPAIESSLSYLSGASMLVSRRFLDLAGPMREEYFLYGEEVEWFLRGRRNRARLGFAPNARVLHHAGTTTGSYDRSKAQPKTPVYLDERNKILVTRDCFPHLLPAAIPAALLLLLVRYGGRRAWPQMLYGVQGWAAGVCNRRGPPHWIDVSAS